MPEEQIGTVEHFFDHIGVAAVRLTGDLAVGDTIHVKGHTTDVSTSVDSMQIEHETVQKAGAGDAVGIRIPEKVRQHDAVFKVTA
ncbi:MAG: translation elongation factor-like protein [Lentisphaerae bacterium]|nr:translation elongation factor-like protein [Lentisphaerota bacterium]